MSQFNNNKKKRWCDPRKYNLHLFQLIWSSLWGIFWHPGLNVWILKVLLICLYINWQFFMSNCGKGCVMRLLLQHVSSNKSYLVTLLPKYRLWFTNCVHDLHSYCPLSPPGLIWSRYSLVIIPKNWNLFAVNFFVGSAGASQLYRIWRCVCWCWWWITTKCPRCPDPVISIKSTMI